MINELQDLSKCISRKIGQPIYDLYTLSQEKLSILPTIILGKAFFKSFHKNGCISNEYIDKISFNLKQHPFNKSRYFSLRANNVDVPFLRFLKVEKISTQIKYNLERLYRSWFDEKAEAFKIVNGMSDSIYPTIFLQPFCETVFTLDTRDPVEGVMTNNKNYENNITNKMPVFIEKHSDLITKVEKILKRPVTVYFFGCKQPQVLSIKNQIMTDNAYLVSMIDLYEKNIISGVDLLRSLKPYFFLNSSIVSLAINNFIPLSGMGLSYGTVIGKMVFKSSDIEMIKNNILFLNEAEPEDMPLIRIAAGIVSTRGGISSHLALISRQMEKPAACIQNICVDTHNKKVILKNGETVGENTAVLLDGCSGRVQLGDSDNIKYVPDIKECTKKYIAQLVPLLNDVINMNKFKKYTILDQIHFGSLNKTFMLFKDVK